MSVDISQDKVCLVQGVCYIGMLANALLCIHTLDML